MQHQVSREQKVKLLRKNYLDNKFLNKKNNIHRLRQRETALHRIGTNRIFRLMEARVLIYHLNRHHKILVISLSIQSWCGSSLKACRMIDGKAATNIAQNLLHLYSATLQALITFFVIVLHKQKNCRSTQVVLVIISGLIYHWLAVPIKVPMQYQNRTTGRLHKMYRNISLCSKVQRIGRCVSEDAKVCSDLLDHSENSNSLTSLSLKRQPLV